MRRVCVLLFLLIASSVFAEAIRPDSASALKTDSASVVLNKDTLFQVYAGVGSFTASERAQAISNRLLRLSQDPAVPLDEICVVGGESAAEIHVGDLIIADVSDADAKIQGMDRTALASQWSDKIHSALSREIKNKSQKNILMSSLLAVVTTLGFLLVLFVFKRAFPSVYRKINTWKGAQIRSLKIQQVELLNADRIAESLTLLAKIIRAAATALAVYLWISLLFSFFSWTHGWAAKLFEYILDPLKTVGVGILKFIPNLFFILVIVFLVRLVMQFVKKFFDGVSRGSVELPGFYSDWADPTYKIVRFLLIVIAVVVIFPYIPGSDSSAFKGVSVFVGVLFSLGSTSAVANIVAGFVITYMRPFKVGDRVKIADTVGDVLEKTLLVTRIRTIKNEDITVPNAMVLGSHIVNFSSSAREVGLILHTTVTIGYDAPWRKVHELLIAAARATKHIQNDPVPFVLQTSLDDSYVSYQINAYTDAPNLMAATYAELHENIQDKFNEGGVEIMSPAYHAVRDGNHVTTPADYLPKEYHAPGFKIQRDE